MAVLTLQPAGANISLSCSKGGKATPTDIGEESPSFNQTMRNSVRGQKRVWQVVTVPIDTTTQSNVQSLVANKAQIPCTGTLLDSATITCSITVVSCEMVIGGLFWVMTLTLKEV